MKLSTDLPLYESLKRALQERIETGELPVGARILPEIELAKQMGVSRSTARKALQGLEMEGYLSRTAGRGSFVKARRPRSGESQAFSRGTLAASVCALAGSDHADKLMQGFIHQAIASGYQALVPPYWGDGLDEFEHLVHMCRGSIDGWALWLTGATEKNIGLLRHFRANGGALVLVDRYAHHFDADFVVTRNDEMAFALTRELLRRGHDDVAFLGFPPESTVDEDLLTGFRRGLAASDLALNPDFLVAETLYDLEPLRMQILALLGLRQRPTAILCASARHAEVLIEELERLGYGIPSDIEVALVDDNRLADRVDVPLLCARHRSYEMGRTAAQLLEARIEHPTAVPQQIRLEHDVSFTVGC
ncbi:MAG TPA: GntR family transcriptional regulator [Candidatus Hydrogenedentes bacterium]|nr:GntR family transcriptional regulator [Candidatus Hydrogenedentota bacterium]